MNVKNHKPILTFPYKGKEYFNLVSQCHNTLVSSKKTAFTLAEVLITLSIIGVVAALTMPTLIHKHKAKVLRTYFLQANTILADVTSRAKLDDTDLKEVIYTRDYTRLYKYFKTGNCTTPKDAEEAKYKDYSGKYYATGAAATKLYHPYCLSNGAILWLATVNYNKNTAIAIDIDGWGKGPQKYGKDVFFWFYNEDKEIFEALNDEILEKFTGRTEFFVGCPTKVDSCENGIGCTPHALSDPKYFEKLKF